MGHVIDHSIDYSFNYSPFIPHLFSINLHPHLIPHLFSITLPDLGGYLLYLPRSKLSRWCPSTEILNLESSGSTSDFASGSVLTGYSNFLLDISE